MYREMTVTELLKLNGAVLTEKEYFLDLIENENVTNHDDSGEGICYRNKWITVADEEEIFIKVVK